MRGRAHHQRGTLTNQTTVTRAEADAYLPNNAAVALTTVQVPAITINDVSVFERRGPTWERAADLYTPSAPPSSIVESKSS